MVIGNYIILSVFILVVILWMINKIIIGGREDKDADLRAWALSYQKEKEKPLPEHRISVSEIVKQQIEKYNNEIEEKQKNGGLLPCKHCGSAPEFVEERDITFKFMGEMQTQKTTAYYDCTQEDCVSARKKEKEDRLKQFEAEKKAKEQEYRIRSWNERN